MSLSPRAIYNALTCANAGGVPWESIVEEAGISTSALVNFMGGLDTGNVAFATPQTVARLASWVAAYSCIRCQDEQAEATA